mgnify:CR=1 FL=1
MISLALSKGRILEETLPLLEAAGVVPSEHPDESRKLIIPTSRPDVRLIIVRATDGPTYVQYGAADLGVVGGHHQRGTRPAPGPAGRRARHAGRRRSAPAAGRRGAPRCTRARPGSAARPAA